MKLKNTIQLLVLCLALSGCNDDFLEKSPIEKQTEQSAFRTYENFKTYAWGLYSVFDNTNILRRPGNHSENGFYQGDILASYLSKKGASYENDYAFQKATVPSNGGGFDFAYVRRVNLLLDNVDKSAMKEEDKKHWKSVGYFFRCYYYYELISRFGDVPWLEHVVQESDNDVIFAPQTPRDEVAKNMLENLLYAEENIKAKGDGQNTINQNVVRALISRFGLFEGTWRKYHGLSGADKYLTECVRTSELLMKAYPTLHPYYDEMFTSPDLGVIPGVILYKEFAKDVLTNNLGHFERTSSNNNQMNKNTVEMFLCTDGKPISTSPLYDGDKSLYDEMRNRDPRLLLNVAPPYHVNMDGTPTGNPKDAEYIEKMKTISREGHKQLPLYNWNGSLLDVIPNVEPKPSRVYMGCRTGYYMYKNYNTWDTNSNMQQLNVADKPLFKIEEVMLNYAEAQFELGMFDQSVADKSINKLRARQNVGVAPMVVSEINANFDPARDPKVDPIAWEIRRERIVELMGEGFGFYDIRRWKRADWFINKQVKGLYARKSDYKMGNKVFLNPETGYGDSNLTEGYLYVSPDPVKALNKGWLDKYYLYPVPSKQLLLNDKLVQSPGWENF